MRQAGVFTCLLLSAGLLASPAIAGTRLGDACDLGVLGARGDAVFLQFDRALRDAVERRDAAALSGLVLFPLRMTWKDGAHATVADAAALRGRLPAASWVFLHKAVSAQKPAQLFCNVEGVMYGNGELWASPDAAAGDHPFRITAINLPENAPAPVQGVTVPAATQLVCSTDKFHIVIDTARESTPRYRSWNRPHGPPGTPAMDLVGKEDGEGIGVCFRRSWRFANGNVDYVLSEPGCNDGSVPTNVKARLEVSIAGKTRLESWCY